MNINKRLGAKSIVLLVYILTIGWFSLYPQEEGEMTAEEILVKVDANRNSKTRQSKVRMIVYGERNKREMALQVYSMGDEKSFSEFLTPKRDKGTKMLRVEDRLWIYSPNTDRTVQLSGHLLRQSMMGSDLSYEDMMEDRKLQDIYHARILGSEEITVVQGEGDLNRPVYQMELIAKMEDVNYARVQLWVDREYFLPLEEELYAKSGILLKRLSYGDLEKVGKRWIAKKMVFKDMLKSGGGTEFLIDEVEFNVEIPDSYFTKGVLRK